MLKQKVKQIHFIGVGGSGMSGIAEVLLNSGFRVSGSDLVENAATRRLKMLGAKIHQGHAETYVEGADVVVVSTAVSEENPEVRAARARGIPVVPRAKMLAELMRLRQGIAVAGTHGKTTTTSLVASVLAEAGLDPTFVIGGRLEAAGSHAKLGTGEFIVVEADESDASFLYLQPIMAVVTNIDADHMDTYHHDFGKLKQAFVDFLQHLPFYGSAVLCVDDARIREIMPFITRPVATYGLAEAAQVRAVDVAHREGKMQFRVTRPGGKDLTVTLNMPGVHNVQNALAAIVVGMQLGVADAAILKALAGFKGVGRRLQRYGEIQLEGGGSFTLLDDYGHHPVEIAATLDAVHGAFPSRRVVLAFQPHRYSRTRDLFGDFVKVLSAVELLLLCEVYAAGEKPIAGADGKALTQAIRLRGKEPIFVETVAELPLAIRKAAQSGDVVVTMGAGSIGSVPAMLTQSAA